MGCSSGKIKHTPIGGTGTPVEYMLSGCPAVLGYLWNITDRDCDRLECSSFLWCGCFLPSECLNFIK